MRKFYGDARVSRLSSARTPALRHDEARLTGKLHLYR